MREGPRGTDGPASPGGASATPPRPGPHLVVRTLVWAVAYAVAVQIGLHATVPGQPLVLLSPSNGVLVLWLSFATRRTLAWDVAAIALLSAASAVQLGLPLGLVLVAPVVSLATGGVFVATMRRAARGLAPYGEDRLAWRMTDLGALLAASVLAALVVASLSTLTQHLAGLPTGEVTTLLVRWGRSAAAMVLIASLGLLVLTPARASWRDRTARADLGRVLRSSRPRAAEAVLLLLATAALYTVVFGLLPELPLTFILFVTTAWVGVRFPPTVAALHCLVCGVVAVGATLAGQGVFAVQIPDPAERAAIVQLFVAVLWTTALSLAVSRQQLLAAERLADSRLRLLEQVVESVDDGIALVDRRGRLLMLNRAGAGLLDLTDVPEEVPAMATMELVDNDGRRVTEDRAPHRRVLAGEAVVAEDYALRTTEGGVRYLRLTAVEVPAGESRRVLVSYHDVTEDRRRVDALTTFAGNVAHDLRGPLTVVEAWNEVLADTLADDGSVPADQGLPITAKIAAASWRMRDFIKVLLDYTLARDRPLDLEAVDLAAVSREVADLRGQTRPLGPGADVEPPVIRVVGSGTALADRVLVQIVVDNLVSNACKYVAPGVRPQILVTVESDAGTVQLTVLDNGIGIPADQRERVFESFHRVEHSGQIEGTGLGLGICHRIVERHGGSISVADVADGTSLRVLLPAAPEPDDHRSAATRAAASTGSDLIDH